MSDAFSMAVTFSPVIAFIFAVAWVIVTQIREEARIRIAELQAQKGSAHADRP